MDDPNYLNPDVVPQHRALCNRLVKQADDVYELGIEMMNLVAQSLPDDVPGRLYVIWGELTDNWELHPEKRQQAEQQMRDAAAEFLTIDDYTTELDGYLSRWSATLGIR